MFDHLFRRPEAEHLGEHEGVAGRQLVERAHQLGAWSEVHPLEQITYVGRVQRGEWDPAEQTASVERPQGARKCRRLSEVVERRASAPDDEDALRDRKRRQLPYDAQER